MAPARTPTRAAAALRTQAPRSQRAPAHAGRPLTALLLLGACGPATDAQTFPEILDEAIDRELPGIVLVVDSPDTARSFRGAAGLADTAGSVPMTVDAGFRIASNSKTFVGLAIASMQVDGLLDIDLPLADLLDSTDLQGIANVDRATLRQALNHTSGIPDYLDGDAFWDAVDRGRSAPWSIRDALDYARGEPAEFTPGTDWFYSNTNYLLAGLALEQDASGSWGSAIRARVLDPLGMSASFVENEEEVRTPIVHGYAKGEQDMLRIDTGYGLPDGGVVATAPELAGFIRAVGGGTPVTGTLADAIDMLLDDAADSGEGDRYGLGLGEFATPCGRTLGHGGYLDGYLSEMFYVPSRDLAVVAFVNASDGWVDDVFEDLVQRTLEIACER